LILEGEAAAASVPLEGQVLEGAEVAVVPERHDLMFGQLLDPVHHQLADILEVAIENMVSKEIPTRELHSNLID
jgi:hypothetical protein